MAMTAGGAGGSQTHPMRLPMFDPLRRDRLFHRHYSTTIQSWMQRDRAISGCRGQMNARQSQMMGENGGIG